VTTGEAPDGEYLKKLVEQSKRNGVKVKEATADMAYSSKDNIEYAKENGIKLISKLNPVISNGSGRSDEGFVYNKDADRYQCPAGHLAKKKKRAKRRNQKGRNERIVYHFDTKKCEECRMREGCCKAGAKTKTYSITILGETHKEQKEFQETEYFKERARQRYMIEAKNAELKQAHGLDKADSVGVVAMRKQSFITAFVANIKRIVKLMEVKAA